MKLGSWVKEMTKPRGRVIYVLAVIFLSLGIWEMTPWEIEDAYQYVEYDLIDDIADIVEDPITWVSFGFFTIVIGIVFLVRAEKAELEEKPRERDPHVESMIREMDDWRAANIKYNH